MRPSICFTLNKQPKKNQKQLISRYWLQHNIRYNYEKQNFLDSLKKNKQDSIGGGGGDKTDIDPNIMSTFYESYLIKTYSTQEAYNREWNRKNLQLLVPAFKLAIYRLYCILFSKGKKK